MSNPPNTSSFEHRVRTVTSLLATYICHTRRVSDESIEELCNQAEARWEARENIIRQPGLQVPWSERLGAFWDNYWAYVRATQTILSMLAFTWWMATIRISLFLLSNIPLTRNVAMWADTLVSRWAWTHNQRSRAPLATLRDEAQQQLPDLTDSEADWMVRKITFLALVATLLGLTGLTTLGDESSDDESSEDE